MTELIELLKTKWLTGLEIRKILNISYTNVTNTLLYIGEHYPLAEYVIDGKPVYKIITEKDFESV